MTIPIDSYTSLNGIKRYICTLGKKVLFSMDIPPPLIITHTVLHSLKLSAALLFCKPSFINIPLAHLHLILDIQQVSSKSPSAICSTTTASRLWGFCPISFLHLRCYSAMSLHVSLLQNYICYSCSLYINKSLFLLLNDLSTLKCSQNCSFLYINKYYFYNFIILTLIWKYTVYGMGLHETIREQLWTGQRSHLT